MKHDVLKCKRNVFNMTKDCILTKSHPDHITALSESIITLYENITKTKMRTMMKYSLTYIEIKYNTLLHVEKHNIGTAQV